MKRHGQNVVLKYGVHTFQEFLSTAKHNKKLRKRTLRQKEKTKEKNNCKKKESKRIRRTIEKRNS
jgi:hypothetical protein